MQTARPTGDANMISCKQFLLHVTQLMAIVQTVDCLIQRAPHQVDSQLHGEIMDTGI